MKIFILALFEKAQNRVVIFLVFVQSFLYLVRIGETTIFKNTLQASKPKIDKIFHRFRRFQLVLDGGIKARLIL